MSKTLPFRTAAITVTLLTAVATIALAGSTAAASSPGEINNELLKQIIDEQYPELETICRHLHANPELSLQEKETSALVAREFRAAGFEVTENVGGYGVVGVLRNGEGPTVLLRGDMDALPITEKTGLPFASKVRMKDQAGREVGVMHACGHDIHTSVLIGNARVLAKMKDHWSGTLVLVAQPAEEGYGGAQMMFDSGLYERFPRPDYALALHVAPNIPAGSIGYTEGQAMAGTLSMKVTVRGLGGHGAIPHTTKDPIVIAARLILALQTIVSREIDPNEPAVITVGEIHGGTAANIIPDEVALKLNLRFANDAVMNHMLEAIERECRGIAISAGLPETLWPVIERSNKVNPPVFNDSELTGRVTAKFREFLGEDKVVTIPLVTASEDFALFRDGEPPVKTLLFWLGITDPEFIQSVKGREGALTESEAGRLALHTPYMRAEQEPSIKTGVGAMCTAVLDLLDKDR